MRKIPFLHLILFILTFFSTMAVGAMHEGVNLIKEPQKIYQGLPFSLSILIILLAHEFSHYFMSKKHRVVATLPYFIPAPTLFGTLGAVIKMKSPITTRNALVDIGASGPIGGFIVSVAATLIGLLFSKPTALSTAGEVITLGDSILFSLLTRLVFGKLPATHDIFLHPVAFAGWIGFFITSLNLIPVGQLDGGHIAYALFGEKHEKISKILIVIMVVLGVILWEGWLVWAVLLMLLGLKHPPILYHDVPLDERRKKTGWLALIIFILTFTPVPIAVA